MYNTKFEDSAVNCFWVVLITDIHIYRHTHRHTDQTLKMWFSASGDLKTCKSIKISTSKIWPKKKYFLYLKVRESKKSTYHYCLKNEKKGLIGTSKKVLVWENILNYDHFRRLWLSPFALFNPKRINEPFFLKIVDFREDYISIVMAGGFLALYWQDS